MLLVSGLLGVTISYNTIVLYNCSYLHILARLLLQHVV